MRHPFVFDVYDVVELAFRYYRLVARRRVVFEVPRRVVDERHVVLHRRAVVHDVGVRHVQQVVERRHVPALVFRNHEAYDHHGSSGIFPVVHEAYVVEFLCEVARSPRLESRVFVGLIGKVVRRTQRHVVLFENSEYGILGNGRASRKKVVEHSFPYVLRRVVARVVPASNRHRVFLISAFDVEQNVSLRRSPFFRVERYGRLRQFVYFLVRAVHSMEVVRRVEEDVVSRIVVLGPVVVVEEQASVEVVRIVVRIVRRPDVAVSSVLDYRRRRNRGVVVYERLYRGRRIQFDFHVDLQEGREVRGRISYLVSDRVGRKRHEGVVRAALRHVGRADALPQNPFVGSLVSKVYFDVLPSRRRVIHGRTAHYRVVFGVASVRRSVVFLRVYFQFRYRVVLVRQRVVSRHRIPDVLRRGTTRRVEQVAVETVGNRYDSLLGGIGLGVVVPKNRRVAAHSVVVKFPLQLDLRVVHYRFLTARDGFFVSVRVGLVEFARRVLPVVYHVFGD